MISKTRIKERIEKKSNPVIIETIKILRKQKSPFWHRVAELISKPKRKMIVVNISKINRIAKDNEIVVVPGKLLGKDKLERKIVLAALSSSEKAKENAKIMNIADLIKKNPKGTGARIIV